MTSTGPATTFTRTPGVLPLFAISIVARLPLATLTIGLLVHVKHLTGSFGAAGLVSGALAVAQGVGGPLLGRLADRRGQTMVLVGSALVAATALGVLGTLRPGTPVGLLVSLAGLLGLATPPVGACMRTLFPTLVPSDDGQRRAYAIDAAASELTWVSGPPLVLLVGTLWGSGTALITVGAVLLVATLLFAASRASRRWQSSAHVTRAPGGALRSAAMRTLVLVMVGVGVLFGATEVAVAAAADALGHPAATGQLLGLWGLGSLVGGVVATRVGGGARTGRGLAVLLAALGAGHLLLAPASTSVVTLGAVLALAGTMIAPILASAYALVDDAAPAGTVTEAFAWLATATAIGTSAGAAAAGAIADASGSAAAFVVAGLAAVAAALLALLRLATPAATPTIPAVLVAA
jgi:MFS family permease